jgi:predicted peptidase
MKLLIVFSLAAALAFTGCATQEPLGAASMQTAQKFEKKVKKKVQSNYLLYLPSDYSPTSKKRWPLMLFLHGAGERGTNLTKVAAHGPPKLVAQGKKDLPFIIVSPQCPTGDRWKPEVLTALLDDVIAKYRADTNRLYLTGLSMGGYGTWALAAEHPERFAAIAPICGGGDTIPILLAGTKKKAALKSLGVWAFHGAKDPVVKLEESEKMVNAFKQIGGPDVRLTVYPDAGHDSWTETYDDPKLYEWFLGHKR